MKHLLQQAIHQPELLEELYQQDKRNFKKSFEALYPELESNPIAQVWHARLQFKTATNSRQNIPYWLLGLLLLAMGFIAKLPIFFELSEEIFYPRNLGFIVLPALMIYFIVAHQNSLKHSWLPLLASALSAVFINVLPNQASSDTLLLACLHLPFFLFSMLGLSYLGSQYRSNLTRIAFLRYAGDLVVMSSLLFAAAGLLSAMSFGLFSLIQVNIEQVFSQYLAYWGTPAIPLIATYLVHTQPQLVHKVSPMIAKIFTPLVLFTLLSFLAAMLVTGKDPYNDREFLLTFNLLLLGVMALILFSMVELPQRSSQWAIGILLALALTTILVNGIALSAILFRISSWGFTPNRLAVLGGNVLLLIHLFIATRGLYRALRKPEQLETIAPAMAAYLPVYLVWSFVVVFLFPLLFQFK